MEALTNLPFYFANIFLLTGSDVTVPERQTRLEFPSQSVGEWAQEAKD